MEHPEEDLIARLRNVRMLNDPSVEVYRNATITVEKLRVELLSPPQRYVLVPQLKLLQDLRWALSERGVDLLDLSGWIEMEMEGREGRVGLIPPVVEESVEADGRITYIINDGMHRVYLARVIWAMPRVVLVRGIDKRYPYYAYPNPQGWDNVALLESLPADFTKKWYRIPDRHTLYRDFATVFGNLSVPRPQS